MVAGESAAINIQQGFIMKKCWFLLILVCLAAFAGAAYSTPSTLIWIPSTDIQPAKVGHLGIDVYVPSAGNTLTDFGLTIGDGKGIEGGIDYLSMTGQQDPVRFNAKVSILKETSSVPAVVAGVYDFGGDAASNIVYALGSKSFSFGRFTFGYGIGKEAVLGNDNGMVFLGFDKMLSSKWWGAVDYQSGNSAFGAASAGVAYSFSPSTSLIVGYDWYNDSALSDTVTVQLDTNF
jgi:hypothetical protein